MAKPEVAVRRMNALASLACIVLALGLPSGALRADDLADLHSAVAFERSRAPAPRLERADFLAQPEISSAMLSPDGRHVAVLRGQQRGRSLWLLDTGDHRLRRLLASTDATQLAWSRDGRWLFLESARQVSKLALSGTGGSGVMLRLDGKDQRELAGVDPSQPAAVLMFEQVRAPGATTPSRYRLWRVSANGRRTLLHEDRRALLDFAIGPDGRLAFLRRVEGEHLSIVGRLPGQPWREVLRNEAMERASFLATSADGSNLLLIGDIGGDRRRLLRLDMDGQLHVLHADPEGLADLDDVVLDPRSQQPLIATYRSVVAANYALNPMHRRQLAVLRARLPGSELELSLGSERASPWLVRERGDRLQHARWHLFDPVAGTLREILAGLAGAPRLPGTALARKIPVAWRGSDGMRLHGFLSIPPGLDARRLPLVAAVHGGPWSQVRPGFSPATQFLVNRGYIVFEPNFRGSTGFGREYLFAARGDFGNGRVQADVEDGVRYLLARGIGDARRVGIAGVSFGGYSSLLGVTFSPELFRVGVAVVPPSDFGWTLRWATVNSDVSLDDAIPLASTLKTLSLDLDDSAAMARLSAQSPLANARQLTRPVLLMAGGRDQRVAIRSVVHYAAMLRSLGKPVSLYIDPEAGHGLDDPRSREAYFYLMETMLHRHLRGARPTPPGTELREQLRRNLRLAAEPLLPDGGARPPRTSQAKRAAE